MPEEPTEPEAQVDGITQRMAWWGFIFETKIPQNGDLGFFMLAALGGALDPRLYSCEDCGTPVLVPVIEPEDMPEDQTTLPVNLHVRYCPAITVQERAARAERRKQTPDESAEETP